MFEFDGWTPFIFLVLTALVLALITRNKLRRRQAVTVASAMDLPRGGKSWLKKLDKYLEFLFALGVTLLAIAVLNPRSGESLNQTERAGIAIHLLIDRSGSMQDGMNFGSGNMTRLDTVKRVITQFLTGKDGQSQPRKGDLIAASTFAAFYDEISPFTRDHHSLADALDSVDYAERYEDGTQISDALYQAVLRYNIFDKKDSIYNPFAEINSKIIILLTDGKQSDGWRYSMEDAVALAVKYGVRIYTIEIKGNQSMFFSFFDNNSSDFLKNVAEDTGGSYAEVSSGEDLIDIYNNIDKLEKSRLPLPVTVYDDWYFPFLLAGALALLLFYFLRYTYLSRIP